VIWLRSLIISLSLFVAGFCPVVIENGVQHSLCDQVFDGDVTLNGTVTIPGGTIDPTAAKKTTVGITYYVRTTGSDLNDCLAVGTACLTPQAALDKIPEFIGHAMVVDIGTGTFGGFVLKPRIYTDNTVSLTIKGTLGLVTPATGTNAGTATSGDTFNCTDSGQTWTANDLRGKLALVNGEYRVIRTNTATSMELVGPLAATCSGKAYQIVEQKTILNTANTIGTEVISVYNQTSTGAIGRWFLQDIRVDSPGAVTRGIYSGQGSSGNLQRLAVYSQAGQTGIFVSRPLQSANENDLYVNGGATGFNWTSVYSSGTNVSRHYSYGASDSGAQIWYSDQFVSNYLYVDNAAYGVRLYYSFQINLNRPFMSSITTYGVRTRDVTYLSLTGVGNISSTGTALYIITGGDTVVTDMTLKSTNSHAIMAGIGIGSEAKGGYLYVSNSTLKDNGGSAIYAAGPGTSVRVNSVATAGGTGNTRFGIELEDGAQAYVRSGIIANPLTGTMGNATIEDAKTVLTWSTDFATNLSSVWDQNSGCRIKRRD